MEQTKTNLTTTKLKYIPAFDGIRGLFSLIIISHHLPVLFLRVPFSIGWELLQIFFVMSGFLITMILLKEKAKYPFKEYGRRFYLKRIYRIFPLYFGYLFLMVLIGFLTRDIKAFDSIGIWRDLQQNWAYLFTYTYNLKEIFNLTSGVNFNMSPIFTHLWSLSLEEQFYVFFPLIVYFLSEKNLKRLLITIVIISPIIRGIGFYYLNNIIPVSMPEIPMYDKSTFVSWILHHNTMFQLDTLCCGAALAVFKFDWLKPIRWFYFVLFLFVGLMIINGLLDVHNGLAPSFREAILDIKFLGHNYQPLYIFTLGNLLAMLLILITFEKNNPFKFFEWKFFVEMGRISYGMYVLHFFIMIIYLIILKVTHISPNFTMFYGTFWKEVLAVIGYYALVIFISKMSYKYYESYFLRLKEKLDKQ